MLEIIIILVCIFLNAFLAAYEMAFVSSPRPVLRKLAREGKVEAAKVLLRRDKPARTLSAIQVGISIVGLTSAAVGGAGAQATLFPYFEKIGLNHYLSQGFSILLVVLPLTYFTVILGELVPKTLALRHPVRITLSGLFLLRILERIFSPLIFLLEWGTHRVLKLTSLISKYESYLEPTATTIELDTLSKQHRQYVINLVNIETKRIRDIMNPWKNVVAVSENDTIEEVTSVALQSGHTRLPVCGSSESGDVVGILHTKELMVFADTGNLEWKRLLRPPVILRSDLRVLSALRVLQDKKSHMAIVYSEDNLLLGIVTLEDILEEVVGDIYDEDDR